MHRQTRAIVCFARWHGETGAVVRLLTPDLGLIAAYVAGGRGRHLRPLLIPGNCLSAELRARTEGQMPHARVELLLSRAPWLAEPLPAAAIGWATALSAAALPDHQAYPPLYAALDALLDAICHAPSARGWLPGLIAFEGLVLRELGYGGGAAVATPADWPVLLAAFDALGRDLARYPLADRRGDVMAARAVLRQRLGRIEA